MWMLTAVTRKKVRVHFVSAFNSRRLFSFVAVGRRSCGWRQRRLANYISDYQSLYISIYITVYISIYISVYISVYFSIYLSTYDPVLAVSFHPCLPVYLRLAVLLYTSYAIKVEEGGRETFCYH